MRSTASDGSPRRDCAGVPSTPTTSPRSRSISPVRLVSQRSWIRPERSTRSRKTSLPWPRRAITRPASRRGSPASWPGSSRSASARTAATSTRPGNRFGAAQPAADRVTDRLGIGAEVDEDASRDALVLAHDPEEEVLRADVVRAGGDRLAERQLEHPLRPRRERDLAGDGLLSLADDALDLGAHLVEGDVERPKHRRRDPVLLAEQAEQQVLGADVAVPEGARFLLPEDDRLPCSLGEALEQPERSVARSAPKRL